LFVTVTGASGHVGANLVRLLREQGRKVRAVVHHDLRGVHELDIDLVKADILDPASLKKAFSHTDTVFHLAAHISISKRDTFHTYRVNVEGTGHVIEACRTCGVRRLVHFSSIHALSSHPKSEVIDETRPLVEKGRAPFYDCTKADAERLVLRAVDDGLDAVILNPTAIIGPNDFRPSHMGDMLLSLYNFRLRSLVRGGFNWVDVRDVIQGALSAEKRGRRGERYLLGGTWLSIEDLSHLVEEVTGRRAPGFVSPMWLAHLGVPFIGLLSKLRGRRPLYTRDSLHAVRNHRYITHEKAARELGFTPRPLRETIEDTFRWFGEHNYLD
jgi:dihydroflavonol-4-reductase